MNPTVSAAAPAPSTGADRWRWFVLWLSGLMSAWTGAWLLHDRWFAPHGWALGGWASTLWWTLAKLVIWIAPAVWMLRRDGQPLGAATGLSTARGLPLGLGLAAAWLAIQIAWSALRREWPQPPASVPGAWNACLLAPLFEELVFRGVVLRKLRRRGVSFVPAALATTLAFGLLHVPGWLFMQGATIHTVTSLMNVLVVGAILAAISWRIPSLWACVLVHLVNNAWHSGVLLALAHG